MISCDKLPVIFSVEGEPSAQPRPRFNRRNGHVYTPTTPALAYKQAILLRFKALKQKPLAGPVSLDVLAVFPVPDSYLKKQPGRFGQPHIVPPDIDNVVKAVLDALNGWAWVDDKQIAELRIRKQYVETLEHAPHTRIVILPLTK